ncbi:glycosyltransferase [Flagellimonas olearia]|uniref:Glycosyltransferase n=1 Tax=Flagellimonas olearia TaxID=552546 RepID=A0A444VL53_9FLAO|nr:glycosyltransferase [Allomuricauda olearia]RYC51430.1 hypothetical protein DN53_14635 [Allomuricauda olearia]
MARKKIIFVLPTLTAGGAERVISFIAQNLDKNSFDSKLLILGDESSSAFSVEGIDLIFFNKKRVLHAVPKLYFFLLREKPDFILSSIGHLNTVLGLLSFFLGRTKVFIREASVVSSMGKYSKRKSRLRGRLAIIAYNRVSGIICQSKDMAKDFALNYPGVEGKITTIANPLTSKLQLKSVESDSRTLKVITIGRLSKEKGQARLLKILSKLKRDFHYTILGDGPQKEELLKLADSLGLMGKITFVDHSKDIQGYLEQNDLFLQGSYVEGFPNTVLESCMVGTPVLAFNVPGGTKEIITHNENGFLVEDEDSYLECLENHKYIPPAQIRESVISKFEPKKILGQYENLFKP